MSVVNTQALPTKVKLVDDRMKYVVEKCQGKVVLHIGCVDSGLTRDRLATGRLLHDMLVKACRRVYGIDIDAEGIKFLAEAGFKDLYVWDACALEGLALPEPPDILVATELVEHLTNPGLFLDSVRRAFPTTPLVLSVPNAYSWPAWQAMLKGDEQVHFDHNFYFSHKTVETLLRKSGFRIDEEVVYSWGIGDPGAESLRNALARNLFFGDGIILTVAAAEPREEASAAPPRAASDLAATLQDPIPEIGVRAAQQVAGQDARPSAEQIAEQAAEQTSERTVERTGAGPGDRTVTRTATRTITVYAGDSGNFHFISPIAQGLQASGRDVSLVPLEGPAANSPPNPEGRGIVWFEWGNGPVIPGTRSGGIWEAHPVIVRMHKYEIFSQTPRYIDWNRVDAVIFVSNVMRDTFARLHPQQFAQIRHSFVVFNGVDLEKFRFREKRPGFELGCIARVHPDKNLPLLVECMDKLRKVDPLYRCEVIGRVMDFPLAEYLGQQIRRRGLQDNLVLKGEVREVPEWLEGKSYVVQTSVCEGHPVGLLEGMATGTKPVVHSFYGIEDGMFPPGTVFDTPEDFVRIVTSGDYDSASYREFVRTSFTVETQIEAVLQVLAEAERVFQVRSSRDSILSQVQGLVDSRDLGAAQRLLIGLAKELPADPQVLNDLAVTCYMQGDFVNAETLLRKALLAKPDHEDARANLTMLTANRPPGS